MTVKVADASAIVALLFNEVTREAVAARLRDVELRAPSILPYEVANACVKKMRAYPAERGALLEAFSMFPDLDIELEPVDVAQVVLLAERAGLSVYDASYLWLAVALDAELVTLDAALARWSGR